jgi:hypothetical protein
VREKCKPTLRLSIAGLWPTVFSARIAPMKTLAFIASCLTLAVAGSLCAAETPKLGAA